MMVAALYSNEGLNDDKGTRQKAIEDIEESYQEAISSLVTGVVVEEEEIDTSNPFWGAMEKGMEKIHGPKTTITDARVADVMSEEQQQQDDFSRYIDQS
jgi:hypothetical protein